MRDPFSWSIPTVRLFGIHIRIHLLFPFVALAVVLRAAYRDNAVSGAWADAAIVMGLLFLSVLLHEFGHCFGARWVGGDATEVLLWPLGGLAAVDVPNTPRANFITTLSGPGVNIVLCLLSLVLLQVVHDTPLQPSWFPFAYDGRFFPKDAAGTALPDAVVALHNWRGEEVRVSPYSKEALLGWFFWCNYFLALLNLLLFGFPLDGGRLLQCALWPYVGYRQATLTAVFVGFVVMFVVGLYGIIASEMLALCLAAFIYVACKQHWIVLETGGDDSLFGTYDFSQGYTSLEREQGVAPAKPKLSWWQRWQQRRQARKMQMEQERREADERRMDQLLEKISAQGMGSLTDEERRFMKQFSDRYKKPPLNRARLPGVLQPPDSK